MDATVTQSCVLMFFLVDIGCNKPGHWAIDYFRIQYVIAHKCTSFELNNSLLKAVKANLFLFQLSFVDTTIKLWRYI